ncbi:hypothetical protein FV238_00050 [Escherichia coli]|nr:hypothetical protein FV238_00050 [Escherichia coli]
MSASGWELVSGLDSSLLHLFTITQIFKEYLIMAGNTLLKQNPELYWQILAEAASIAQGKEQQKQDTIKKP